MNTKVNREQMVDFCCLFPLHKRQTEPQLRLSPGSSPQRTTSLVIACVEEHGEVVEHACL